MGHALTIGAPKTQAPTIAELLTVMESTPFAGPSIDDLAAALVKGRDWLHADAVGVLAAHQLEGMSETAYVDWAWAVAYARRIERASTDGAEPRACLRPREVAR
jgi:hypothetical protein